MTVRNPPTFLQAEAHPAENTRLALSGLLGSPQGVFAGGVITDNVADGDPGHGRVHPADFQVVQNGTPNMTVNVAAGAAWIRGTESATQGSYHVVSDATVNLPIDASDATNARRDLVVLEVKDADYSGSDNEAGLSVVKGTPSGSPADPSVPENALVLARITVGAAVTSITTSDITNFAITPLGYRYAGRVVFTAGNTFSTGDYPWLRAVRVIVVGGGGGGGGAGTTSSNQSSPGRGGGAGGYAESFITDLSTIADPITVTVGAGGDGGVGGGVFNPGSAGGTSSFGSLMTADGGAVGGSAAAAASGAVGAGSSGGDATGGNLRNLTGGGSSVALSLGASGYSSGGGRTLTGNGSLDRTSSGNGFAAEGFGSGGGGAFNNQNQGTPRTGAAGAGGVVIVELYA